MLINMVLWILLIWPGILHALCLLYVHAKDMERVNMLEDTVRSEEDGESDSSR